jgi:hypothetical protein
MAGCGLASPVRLLTTSSATPLQAPTATPETVLSMIPASSLSAAARIALAATRGSASLEVSRVMLPEMVWLPLIPEMVDLDRPRSPAAVLTISIDRWAKLKPTLEV